MILADGELTYKFITETRVFAKKAKFALLFLV